MARPLIIRRRAREYNARDNASTYVFTYTHWTNLRRRLIKFFWGTWLEQLVFVWAYYLKTHISGPSRPQFVWAHYLQSRKSMTHLADAAVLWNF